MHRSIVVLCAAICLAACKPILTFPGGALDGIVTPVPADWSFTDAIKTVQLETRPADPYSVNIWVIALDGQLYVHAGANRARWVEHIEADPRVRIAVGDALYELTATRVTEQAEFDRFSDAYDAKYERRPRNGSVEEAWLFRLLPRPQKDL